MLPSEASKQVLPLLKIGGGILAAYAAYKILQKVGILESSEVKQVKKLLKLANQPANVLDKNNPLLAFKPNYQKVLANDWKSKYQTFGGKGTFSPTIQFATVTVSGAKTLREKVNILIERLKDSKGALGDDELSLYSVFKDINTQYQLSVISTHFRLQHEVDLLEFIKSFTNEKELLTVLTLVMKYPLYIVQK